MALLHIGRVGEMRRLLRAGVGTSYYTVGAHVLSAGHNTLPLRCESCCVVWLACGGIVLLGCHFVIDWVLAVLGVSMHWRVMGSIYLPLRSG